MKAGSILAVLFTFLAACDRHQPKEQSETIESPTLEETLDWITKSLNQQRILRSEVLLEKRVGLGMRYEGCTVIIGANHLKEDILRSSRPSSGERTDSEWQLDLGRLLDPELYKEKSWPDVSLLRLTTRNDEHEIIWRYRTQTSYIESRELKTESSPIKTGKSSAMSIRVRDDWAPRFLRAFTHAIKLCGGGGKPPKEPF